MMRYQHDLANRFGSNCEKRALYVGSKVAIRGSAPEGPHGPSGRPRKGPHPAQVAPLYTAEALTAGVPDEAWQAVTVLDGEGAAGRRQGDRKSVV